VEKRFKPEVLEAADRQFRNLGFQRLFMMAAAANGYPAGPGEGIHSGNISEVLHYAFPPRTLDASFSTMSLPGILQNLANKEILTGYTEEDQTWREVATVKSVSDFKEITSYRLLDNMEYEELPKHGEMKHGKVGEESYTRQVRTYAKMFMLDRVDIINDDLAAFDDLRTKVGGGAARALNTIFWTRFMDNAAFFTAGRANYITGADSALGLDGVGLQKGITAFRKLRTPAADGKKRVVGGRPEILLVPPELEFIAQRIFQSTNVNSGGAATADSIPDANIHAGKYRPVVCDWLSDADFTGNSSTAWYLFRAPRNLAAVVVSFLNGQQNPTVDMAEADFNQLGVQFRGYHDFGVDLAEYLAGIKSKGAA
jgi:phage major head subunit gpT-like protein